MWPCELRRTNAVDFLLREARVVLLWLVMRGFWTSLRWLAIRRGWLLLLRTWIPGLLRLLGHRPREIMVELMPGLVLGLMLD